MSLKNQIYPEVLMKRKIYDFLPTPGQELLLKAALAGKEEAMIAWDRWKMSNDIDRLDKGSYRLLPMVFSNLKAYINKEQELYGKLKGTYRKSWYSNKMIMEAAATLFSDLREEGIEVLLLKGIHLMNSYYDEIASRPIGDADFLVSWEDAPVVDKYMRSNSWRLKLYPPSTALRINSMSSHRSEGYINKQGYQCDLHWNIIGHRCYPDADVEFVRRAVDVDIKEFTFRGLCVEDLFLHILEHGAYGNLEPHIRWVPDILMLIGKKSSIDWDLVFNNVIKTNLEIPVKKMVGYLNEEFGTDEILYLLEKLRTQPVSQRGREIAGMMEPSRTRMGHQIREAFLKYFRYRIFNSDYKKEPLSTGIKGFICFLKFRFGTESNSALIKHIFKRAVKTLVGSLSRS